MRESYEEPSRLPIGQGEHKLGKRELRLPVVEIANKVDLVNPEFDLPFDMKVGEPSKLGLFFTSKPEESRKTLRVHASHGRSGFLGRVVFRDRQGRLYRDIDMKGGGWVKRERGGEPLVKPIGPAKSYLGTSPSGPWGLNLKENAMYDYEMTEKFLKVGLRTWRIIAIIDLEEIVVGDGKVIDLDQARKEGILTDEEQPVLEVRAYATKMRVANSREDGFVYLRDAIMLVAQELGKNIEQFTPEMYLEWFCRTLGEQVGLMHKSGFVHGYLTPGNVTLDCRIIDLDSIEHRDQVESAEFVAGINRDKFCVDSVLASLSVGVETMLGHSLDMDFGELFLEHYNNALNAL